MPIGSPSNGRLLGRARRALALRLATLARSLDPAVMPAGVAAQAAQPRPSFFGLLLRRMLIWFVAASVAFYLTFAKAGLPPSLAGLAAWQDQLLEVVGLDDLFAATLAMAILSASDIIDNILAPREGASDAISGGSGWFLIAAYFVFTLYAAPIYTAPAPHWASATPETRDYMRTELHVLWLVLGLSLMGEFIIASATLKKPAVPA